MRSSRPVLVLTVGLLFSSGPLWAVSNSGVKAADYKVIIDRNPFGLVDPPPIKPVEPPKIIVETVPPPEVELTGMFRDSRKSRTYALFLVQEKGKPEKKSYMLAEGERQEGLQVISIDDKEAKVKIAVQGVESTITFSEKKTPAMPAGRMPTPGAPTTTVNNLQQVPVPQVQPGGVQQFNTSRQGGQFSRSAGGVTAVAGGMQPSAQPGADNNLQAIPTRPVRGQSMTRQEQEVIIELNREILKQQRQQNPNQAPVMPPLPPTSLTLPEDYQRIVVPPSPGGGPPVPGQ